MKIIKLLFFTALFATVCFACQSNENGTTSSNEDIDMSKINLSNIDSLYAQPLSVIQKCVQGKWKWIEISECGNAGLWHPTNTIVNITEDNVIITGDDGLNQFSFPFSWKEKSTTSNYTTYVMWNNEKDTGEWYFDRIQNDTLCVYTDYILPCGSISLYLFYRIK